MATLRKHGKAHYVKMARRRWRLGRKPGFTVTAANIEGVLRKVKKTFLKHEKKNVPTRKHRRKAA